MHPTDQVTSIPGNLLNSFTIDLYKDGTRKARSYAGYSIVGKDGGRQDKLFYWFFESQACSPMIPVADQKELIEKTPLVIWLNGGPGASSLLGMFLENGPFRVVDDDTATIVANQYSWNERVHLMYWDQPVGSGYSYSSPEYYVKDENELSEMFYEALQGFYDMHPEYRECPLYVTGESYAGKYVPFIAKKIDEKNGEKAGPHINLKGIAIGDGWMKPGEQIWDYVQFAFYTGFLDTKQVKWLRKKYEAFKKLVDAGKMEKAFDAGNAIVSYVLAFGGHEDYYDARRWADLPLGALESYLNTDAVKEALHVDHVWQFADDAGPVTEGLKADNMADCTDLFPKLLGAKPGYELLFYEGNFDMACGYHGVEAILQNLGNHGDWTEEDNDKWQNETKRKIWVYAQGDPYGFVRNHRNLTQVTIPGAGHEVPYYKPEISRQMLYTWIEKADFPGYFPEDTIGAA